MLTEMRETWAYLASATLCVVFAGALGVAWCRLRVQQAQTQRERRGREELEAYARLDLRVSSEGDFRNLPRRVCSVIAARSSFSRVAMLMDGPRGRLCIAATEGMDADTVEALETWLRDDQPPSDPIEYWDDAAQVRLGLYSGVMRLKSKDRPRGMAVLVPIRAGGRKIAALLVCADNILEVPHRLAEEAIIGIEALAARLGYAMEDMPASMLRLWSQEGEHRSARYLHQDPFRMAMSSPDRMREDLRISIQKN
jgi:hypothetical protein